VAHFKFIGGPFLEAPFLLFGDPLYIYSQFLIRKLLGVSETVTLQSPELTSSKKMWLVRCNGTRFLTWHFDLQRSWQRSPDENIMQLTNLKLNTLVAIVYWVFTLRKQRKWWKCDRRNVTGGSCFLTTGNFVKYFSWFHKIEVFKIHL